MFFTNGAKRAFAVVRAGNHALRLFADRARFRTLAWGVLGKRCSALMHSFTYSLPVAVQVFVFRVFETGEKRSDVIFSTSDIIFST